VNIPGPAAATGYEKAPDRLETQIFQGSFRVGRHLDGHAVPDAGD